ncbi:MAG: YlbF family regulator [Angelakisella sp.]|nr:YlbF family regulator [Angelakisella sp.]
MDIIKLARELGEQLQQSDEYVAFNAAKTVADDDKELQDLIGQFNLKKIALNSEVQKEDRDAEKLTALNEEIRSLYSTIMQRPSMIAFNTTKEELDKVIGFVQQIIVASANGEDPYGVQEASSSCGGDCSGCSGCH